MSGHRHCVRCDTSGEISGAHGGAEPGPPRGAAVWVYRMRAGRSLIRLFLQCGNLPIPPPAVLDPAKSPRGARRRATHPESLLVNEDFRSKPALDSRGARRVRQLSLQKGSRKRGFARSIEGLVVSSLLCARTEDERRDTGGCQ